LKTDILLTSEELGLQKCIDWVLAPDCGGIDIFIGTVRNLTKGKRVERLEFEAYQTMAVKEMQKLADQAMQQWPVQRIALHHRTGILQVGEVPVIIAVAAAHRDAAFEACRFLIDTLKKTVPIWKKELFEDGEVWVSATP
jgi:molybdopterin synthase catalytic subunit